MVPKGLRKQEVEQGHVKKPQIVYIPVDGEIVDKVKSEAHTSKVKIDNKMTINVAVWTGRNPKGFLIHIISAMKYIEHSKLFEEWRSTKTAADKHTANLQDVQNYLDDLKEKLKKAQPETTTVTTAKKKTKEGMTNTPAIPTDQAEKS